MREFKGTVLIAVLALICTLNVACHTVKHYWVEGPECGRVSLDDNNAWCVIDDDRYETTIAATSAGGHNIRLVLVFDWKVGEDVCYDPRSVGIASKVVPGWEIQSAECWVNQERIAIPDQDLICLENNYITVRLIIHVLDDDLPPLLVDLGAIVTPQGDSIVAFDSISVDLQSYFEARQSVVEAERLDSMMQSDHDRGYVIEHGK